MDKPKRFRFERFGKRLKAARLAHKFEQKELGDLVGCDNRQVWRYERGESMPEPDRLERLAIALGTTVEWLRRGGKGGPVPDVGGGPDEAIGPPPTLNESASMAPKTAPDQVTRLVMAVAAAHGLGDARSFQLLRAALAAFADGGATKDGIARLIPQLPDPEKPRRPGDSGPRPAIPIEKALAKRGGGGAR